MKEGEGKNGGGKCEDVAEGLKVDAATVVD